MNNLKLPNSPANPYNVGNPVTKDDFFGRANILQKIKQGLHGSSNKHFVLYGQPRIGKSSILKQLELNYSADDSFVPIFIDLFPESEQPISKVLSDMATQAIERSGLSLSLKHLDFNEPDTFHQIFLPRFYQSLGDERSLLFLFDEFGALCQADKAPAEMTVAHILPNYLYDLTRQTEFPLAFIFVVGPQFDNYPKELLAVLKNASLSHYVSVLRLEDTRRLIRKAERDDTLRYEDMAVERILTLANRHPLLTQSVCNILFDHAYYEQTSLNSSVPVVTVGDVEAAIPKVLESTPHVFTWIWGHINQVKRYILSIIASTEKERKGLSSDEIVAALKNNNVLVTEYLSYLQGLQEQEILEQIDGGRYRFFVELFGRWVAENHSLERTIGQVVRDAREQYKKGENQAAIRKLQDFLKYNPKHFEAHRLLGIIHQEENQLTDAVTQFEAAYRLETSQGGPEYRRALIQQGQTLKKRGDKERALEVYEKALEIASDDVDILEYITGLLKDLGPEREKRGDSFVKSKNFEEAIKSYEKAISNYRDLAAHPGSNNQRWREAWHRAEKKRDKLEKGTFIDAEEIKVPQVFSLKERVVIAIKRYIQRWRGN